MSQMKPYTRGRCLRFFSKPTIKGSTWRNPISQRLLCAARSGSPPRARQEHARWKVLAGIGGFALAVELGVVLLTGFASVSVPTPGDNQDVGISSAAIRGTRAPKPSKQGRQSSTGELEGPTF